MPIIKGTQSINPIYKGVDKIAKIFKGIDLIYSFGDPKSTIRDTDTVKSFVSYNPLSTSSLYTQYSKTTNTTAVDGSSYATWDISTQSMKPLSISTGETLPSNSYVLNTNYNETYKVNDMVYIIDVLSGYSHPSNLILNNDDLGYYNGVKYNVGSINFERVEPNNITNLEMYNFPASDIVPINTSASKQGRIFFKSPPPNISKIKLKDSHVKLTYESNLAQSIGSNISEGVEIEIIGQTYTRLYKYMLGVNFTSNSFPSSLSGGGVYKIKSLKFNTPNLKCIEDCAINVVYSNINLTGNSLIEVPMSVEHIGSDNTALYYSSSMSDAVFKININGSDKIWNSINTFGFAGTDRVNNPVFNSNVIGLAGISYTNGALDHGYSTEITVPQTMKYISSTSLHLASGGTSNIYLNSNLESYPVLYGDFSIFERSNQIINSVVMGSNVNFVPKGLFKNSSTFNGGITFLAPSNTNITIGENAFYYKSARAVNISYYDPNSSITGYNWSGNQNVTATFVKL